MEAIKEISIDKMHERWRAYKCRPKNKWYKLFIDNELRFTCGNKRVHSEQWEFIVTKWDRLRSQEVAKQNSQKNRKQLRMPHTTGTKTYVELRYQWELEHPGEKLDQITFLKMAYSKKKKGDSPEPINEEA